jgi:hypothetical protein
VPQWAIPHPAIPQSRNAAIRNQSLNPAIEQLPILNPQSPILNNACTIETSISFSHTAACAGEV